MRQQSLDPQRDVNWNARKLLTNLLDLSNIYESLAAEDRPADDPERARARELLHAEEARVAQLLAPGLRAAIASRSRE